MISLEVCTVARAVFTWAAQTHHDGFNWRQYDYYMRKVIAAEWHLRACSKVAFSTFGEADKIAKKRRGFDGHIRRTAHKCQHCGMFHVTDVAYGRQLRRMKAMKRGDTHHA